MLDELQLLSKNDIPFPQGQVSIHPPVIREIGLIGEQSFFGGSNFLTFSKDKFLNESDKNNTSNQSDFDILMSIIINGKEQFEDVKNNILNVLTLLFPRYTINFNEIGIVLAIPEEKTLGFINNTNFKEFKELITQLLCLNSSKEEKDYNINPNSALAKSFLQKFEERRRILANQNKGKNKKVNILYRYVSALAVGENKDMNDLLNYTVYQLFDEYERFVHKLSYDAYVQAKMAGAKDLSEVDHWMKDMHEEDDIL